MALGDDHPDGSDPPIRDLVWGTALWNMSLVDEVPEELMFHQPWQTGNTSVQHVTDAGGSTPASVPLRFSHNRGQKVTVFNVTIFWRFEGKDFQQKMKMPSVPAHGDQVIVHTGFEGTVASRLWLMEEHTVAVHIVLT